eukprot:m.925095 g.925095  ORF g.925095 m.925095 type:complete len:709 (+) comp23772_c0_seq36:524-2650(+)
MYHSGINMSGSPLLQLWPQDNATKSDVLPIEKTDYGFVQRGSWRQVDRLDEEVVELDGPFSMNCVVGTEVFTFVLIGDQNAGKSTFLQSFSHQTDRNFLEMTSLLPVLSASFVNTRFLDSSKDVSDAIDEPPFLDTDIGRATLCLTVDDFAFWVMERELDESLVTSLPDGTRYVVLQFIEFGGDHLDQMMNPAKCPNAATKDIVGRSRTMLAQCRKVAYFINWQSLMGTSAGIESQHVSACEQRQPPVAFNDVAVRVLLERFEFLDTLSSHGTEILVLACRTHVARSLADMFPPKMIEHLAFQALSRVVGMSVFPSADVPSARTGQTEEDTIMAVLSSMVNAIISTKALAINIGDQGLCAAHHINTDGSLNPEGINTTIANLFRRNMVQSAAPPSAFVADHLLRCFKQPLLRLSDTGESFGLFVDRAVFKEYLEDLEGDAEAPDAVLLQCFDSTARSMVEIGVAVAHWSGNLSHLGIMISASEGEQPIYLCVPEAPAETAEGAVPAAGQPLTVIVGGTRNMHPPKQVVGANAEAPGTTKNLAESEQIRFPYHSGLFAIIDTFFARNVPPEMWLQRGWIQHKDGARDSTYFTDAVTRVVCDLRAELAATAQSTAPGGTERDSASAREDGTAIMRWLWHLEDLCLAESLCAHAMSTQGGAGEHHGTTTAARVDIGLARRRAWVTRLLAMSPLQECDAETYRACTLRAHIC